MTDKNVVKQLEELLAPMKKDLGEINKKLEQHTKILDQHTRILDQHTRILGQHTRVLDQHTRILGQHTEKLDRHTGALVNIEDTIKVYGDMYDINNGNVRKLEKRIDLLEDKNGVVAPPELRLANI